jgi:hypothetical protein
MNTTETGGIEQVTGERGVSGAAASSAPGPDVVAVERTGTIAGPRPHGYTRYDFELPADVVEAKATLTYEGDMLFLSVYGPSGHMGTVMNPRARGRVTLEARWSARDASRGLLPGRLKPGRWHIVIDHGPDLVASSYELRVTYSSSLHADAGSQADQMHEAQRSDASVSPGKVIPNAHVLPGSVGWYRGELHAHTWESDGVASPEQLSRAAEEAGLDFISLTDHFTVSGWAGMRAALHGRTLLIRGCEITSRRGHANLHGISVPVDPSVDGDGWSMGDVADAVHAQGGIFCVNHPFSGMLGWRVDNFDWGKADAMEVVHALEGPNNVMQQGFWDHHLRVGRHIVGVAGTDTHDPGDREHRLGRLVNWVYADEQSEAGILEGIRRGRVVVSRGPFVEVRARNAGTHEQSDDRVYGLWDTVPLPQGGDVELTAVVHAAEAVRVFVLKDGLPFAHGWVAPDDTGVAEYVVHDAPAADCYYRVEVHGAVAGGGDEARWKLDAWRDHGTLLALTNPIFVAH